MALDTAVTLRNKVIYSVFVRNYSESGTFDGVRRDLDRIRDLGVDIIWLIPIHPIGKVHRKGSLGSPYAIADYRAVNPEYGTMEDFIALVDAIHQRGMQCIIDVVYNHTAHDAVLRQAHPEWYYHRPDGSFGNRIGDWWDVIDLDYRQAALWDYQIETLRYWARYVDGFRCDVAPLVPIAFWQRARAEVAQVRPGCLWLAESGDPEFERYCRSVGVEFADDTALYTAFDLCYDYDIYPVYRDCVTGAGTAEGYAEAINRQEATYPANYVKARFLENHDKPRAAFLLPEGRLLRNWTALQYFQKGTALVYAGQEAGCRHLPSLFDRDTVAWQGEYDLAPMMRQLYAIKQREIFAAGRYHAAARPLDFMVCTYTPENGAEPQMAGVFSLRGQCGAVEVGSLGVADGTYRELLSGETADVVLGYVSCRGEPMILEKA